MKRDHIPAYVRPDAQFLRIWTDPSLARMTPCSLRTVLLDLIRALWSPIVHFGVSQQLLAK
jgi:hypothetical protein